MAIDEDAPHVQVVIDPSEFEKGLQGLDERFKNSVKKMEKTLNDFKRDAQKAFDELMNGQPKASTGSSSKTSENKSSETSTKRERKDFEKNVIAQEERAFNQRKEQLKKQDEFIKNSKDMVLAIGALATGGMGAKALLDFSHNIGRLQTFLDAINAKMDKSYAIRNELRNHGAEDGEIWGAFQSISDNLVAIQEGNAGRLSEDTQFAFHTLSKYNPKLQIGPQDKALTVDEQMRELSIAAKAYKKANPQLNEAQITKTIADAIGGSRMAAQALLNSNFNFSKADLKKAKEEADAARKNQEIDKEWQKLKIQLEIELAKTMAANAPEIIAVLKALTNFMTNNGQWVMTAGLITAFGSALGGIIIPLKMAINLLRMAGVISPAAAVGGGVLPMVARSPILWPLVLSGDTHETQEQKQAKINKYQEDVLKLKTKAEKDLKNNSSKVKEVEDAVNGKIKYDGRENRLILFDKKGNRIIYVDDLNMTADQLIQKAKDAQSPSMLNPFNWSLFPSAHAEEVKNRYNTQGGNHYKPWTAGTGANVQSKQKYLEDLEQHYGLPKGSLDAQWLQESGRGKYMLSPAGAEGDFGFMPATAKQYGVNVKDFYSSAIGAAKYKKYLLRKFNGDNDRANAGFNWGEGNVDKVIKKYGKDWKTHLPRETRNYVDEVARNAALYRNRVNSPNISIPQLKQAQMMTTNNHRTANVNNTMGGVTINLHGSNASPQGVVEAIKTGVKFPNVNAMDGINTVS